MFPPLAFPCHGKGKDALGDGEYDVQDLARDCIRSQRRALPWEREGEGRRKAEEAFLLMEIAFRFTASNVAVLKTVETTLSTMVDLTCRECHMTFSTEEELANHRTKFCVNTQV